MRNLVALILRIYCRVALGSPGSVEFESRLCLEKGPRHINCLSFPESSPEKHTLVTEATGRIAVFVLRSLGCAVSWTDGGNSIGRATRSLRESPKPSSRTLPNLISLCLT
jgi:hypothetical protein